MPTVWVRSDPKNRTRFHRSPACRQLTKGPARGDGHRLVAMDLDECGVRPCKTCYPDVPRVKIRKPYCPTCQSPLPCEHNGGVRVKRRVTGFPYWVWPDSNSMPLFRRSA